MTITPFIVKKHQNTVDIILVNRGFKANNKTQDNLIIDNKINKKLNINGRLTTPKSKFILGQNLLSQNIANFPIRIQYIDLKLIKEQLQKLYKTKINLNNKILLLDEINSNNKLTQELVFEKNWNYINMSPEKHFGYAVQWFLMALALGVMYCYAVCKWQ